MGIIYKNNTCNAIYHNGVIYENEFKNNKSTRDEKMIYSNGNLYTGEFKNTEESGQSKYIWEDDCMKVNLEVVREMAKKLSMKYNN